MIDDQFIRPDDVEKFLQELRSGQRRQCTDRREAIREGSIDRRTGFDRRDPDADKVFRVAKQSNHKPVINREEQLARLRTIDKVYFGIRITRARCAPAIKLLDVVYTHLEAPFFPSRYVPRCAPASTRGCANRDWISGERALRIGGRPPAKVIPLGARVMAGGKPTSGWITGHFER